MNRTELADAMIRGVNVPSVVESQSCYITLEHETCWACALGCALIGHYDGDYIEAEQIYDKRCFQSEKEEHGIFADLLDISPDLAIEIEHKHLNSQTVQDIAAWLKKGES